MADQPKRRELHFDRLDQIAAEVDRLAAIERGGGLSSSGRWTLGQATNHLAAWIEYAFTPPPLPKPSWWQRLRGRLGKRSALRNPLAPGYRFAGVAGGTLATEVVPTDVARARLAEAIDRLEREAPTLPDDLFGPMTHDEWKQLNLRHAELHLGFFQA